MILKYDSVDKNIPPMADAPKHCKHHLLSKLIYTLTAWRFLTNTAYLSITQNHELKLQVKTVYIVYASYVKSGIH